MIGRADMGRGLLAVRIGLWAGSGLLVLAALAAARLNAGMDWSPGDFVLLAALLAGICGAFELAVRSRGGLAYPAGIAVALGTAALLVLTIGAVGIVGSEDEPANRVYLAVIALGVAGTIAARLRPRGMARAMALTAAAQVLAGIAAVAVVPDLRGFLVGTALFAPLWLVSAWLFARAARA
jgi:hypothetical protein